MDSSARTLSPNKSIHIGDTSALTVSPNKSMHSTEDLDTVQQRRPRPLRPKDAFMGVLEESQETLATINLSSNHCYNRRIRRHHQQVSCQGQGSLLDSNLHKQVPPSSEIKQGQDAHHSQLTHNSNMKSVRFSDHHDHCSSNSLSIQVRIHIIEPIHRKYCDQLYWTEPQMIHLQREAKQVVAHYATHKKSYVAAIHRILQSHRNTTTSSASNSGTCNATNTVANTAASDVVKVLMESNARGLEARIVPLLKFYRKRTVRAVLELQYKLRESGGHSDSEMMGHLLRRKSLQASRPCRHLARQLALGDAAAAQIDTSSSSRSSSVSPISMPSVWLLEQNNTIVEPKTSMHA